MDSGILHTIAVSEIIMMEPHNLTTNVSTVQPLLKRKPSMLQRIQDIFKVGILVDFLFSLTEGK